MENDHIFTIKKMFLSLTPLQKIKEFIHNSDIVFDINNQTNILNHTVQNELILQYPLKTSYRKGFLKILIQELEFRNKEILEELYNVYCNIISLEDKMNETHYRHFILDIKNDLHYITLEESINMISQGTTGLCTWQAASVLSEWCIEHKDLFKGKTIFELGSGIGLLGLSVIKMCSPKRYIFTDGHSKVLNMLCKNIINNTTKDKNIEDLIGNNATNLHLIYKDTDINVEHLLWEDIENWISVTNFKPDFILAADILFDCSVFSSLVHGLKVTLSMHGIQGYIAATVRNEATINSFLNHLDKYNISYQDEVVSKQKIFVHKEDTTVRVIKIF